MVFFYLSKIRLNTTTIKYYNNSNDQDLKNKPKKLPRSATESQQVTKLQIRSWLTLIEPPLFSLVEMVLTYCAIVLNLPTTSKTLNRKVLCSIRNKTSKKMLRTSFSNSPQTVVSTHKLADKLTEHLWCFSMANLS